MIKLYGGGRSRWVKPYWTLKELDVPFEPVTVSIMKGETRTPEYRAMHPFGRVPALQDGDLSLFESGAICTYLGDKYQDRGLVPEPRTKERARYDQWMSFIVGDLEQPLSRIVKHTFAYPEAQRSQADIELARADFQKLAQRLDPLVGAAENGCLVGGQFSVADICLAYTLKWATLPIICGPDALAGSARLCAYLERQTARPAFPRELYA